MTALHPVTVACHLTRQFVDESEIIFSDYQFLNGQSKQ